MNTKELFTSLHENPEFACEEKKTLKILKDFFKNNTDCKIVDHDSFFYAIHDEGSDHTVAVRADIDAIHNSKGEAFHGCGHDGHSSMTAALAKEISGKKFGKNIIFLYQPAEETGEGAKICSQLFNEQNVDVILGLHNIPGYELGEILIGRETFACASLGLTLNFTGVQSHAGCPEEGINPGFAISNLVSKLDDILSRDCFEKYVMATLICISVGEENFGINAGEGKLCLTLRAETTKDLLLLKDSIIEEANKSIKDCYTTEECAKVRFEYETCDEFLGTENDPCDSDRVYEALKNRNFNISYLDAPMRWSEDFGNYSKRCHSFFFGIGSGVKSPGLHMEDYSFPEKLLDIGPKIWEEILELF